MTITISNLSDIKTQKDVDILYTLGSFSTCIVFALELFGFCADGEALAWIQGGRSEPGGELPINTNGADMAEIHSFGWGCFVEMVRQLRGECGLRQVPDAKVVQYACTDGASVIFTKD